MVYSDCLQVLLLSEHLLFDALLLLFYFITSLYLYEVCFAQMFPNSETAALTLRSKSRSSPRVFMWKCQVVSQHIAMETKEFQPSAGSKGGEDL